MAVVIWLRHKSHICKVKSSNPLGEGPLPLKQLKSIERPTVNSLSIENGQLKLYCSIRSATCEPEKTSFVICEWLHFDQGYFNKRK